MKEEEEGWKRSKYIEDDHGDMRRELVGIFDDANASRALQSDAETVGSKSEEHGKFLRPETIRACLCQDLVGKFRGSYANGDVVGKAGDLEKLARLAELHIVSPESTKD